MRKTHKKSGLLYCKSLRFWCRSGGIRTRGLLVPKSLKIQASSIPTKKQNQQTFFSFEGDCIQPLAGFCNSFSPKRKGILPELLHCVNTFSVIPVICEMWFVSSYFVPCVDALRKNSLPVRNSSSVMSHNPTPYCLNHPRWKGLNPRRCPVPFQKLFHIGGIVKNKNYFGKSFRNFRTKHSEKKRFPISRVARALFSSPFSTALARKKSGSAARCDGAAAFFSCQRS